MYARNFCIFAKINIGMDKELIRNIIVENQQLVQSVELVERPFEFEDNGNYVFVGVRQAGKSYMLYQRAKQLLKAGYDIDQNYNKNIEVDFFLCQTKKLAFWFRTAFISQITNRHRFLLMIF